MDLENSEAHDSARTTESIYHLENEAQTAIMEEVQHEAPPLAASAHLQSAIEAPPSPPLFHALEALLGGVDEPAESLAPAISVKPASTSEAAKEDCKHGEATPTTIHALMEDALAETTKSVTESTTADQVELASTVEAIPSKILSSPNQDVPAPADAVMKGMPNETTHIAHDHAFAGSAEVISVGDAINVPVVDKVIAHIGTPIHMNEEARSGANTSIAPDAIMEDTPNDNLELQENLVATGSAGAIYAGDAVTAPVVDNTTVLVDFSEEQEHPEWEVDSSPIESSSDDSSSDESSSDESDEGDNAYKLLTPEEQARILMADGGSDDEGDKPKSGPGNQPRTKNEIPEKVTAKPEVIITPDMKITELGHVETIVENIILIKAKISGEYQVLESGSVLCLENRSIFGAVLETIGRVQQPFYSVMFTNAGEITAAGLTQGTKVFYSEQHSKYVFTQTLKGQKGSDASNIHDEEVGDEEMEFSDDEAEAEYKRQKKLKKMDKRAGRMQQSGGSGRGGHPHPLQQQHTPNDGSNGLSYDDADDDGPYKPLARPAGYADTVGRSEAPEEGGYSAVRPSSSHNRDQFRGRGRGERGRGRGDRGRGDRGRGRGGYQNQRGAGYSLPPQQQRNQPASSINTMVPPPPFQPQGRGFTPPVPPNFFNMPSTQQYSPHQPQLPAWPQFPPPTPFMQQPFSQALPNGQSWPNIPGLNGGAFLNPAFFTNNNSQTPPPGQFNNQGRGRGRGNRGF